MRNEIFGSSLVFIVHEPGRPRIEIDASQPKADIIFEQVKASERAASNPPIQRSKYLNK